MDNQPGRAPRVPSGVEAHRPAGAAGLAARQRPAQGRARWGCAPHGNHQRGEYRDPVAPRATGGGATRDQAERIGRRTGRPVPHGDVLPRRRQRRLLDARGDPRRPPLPRRKHLHPRRTRYDGPPRRAPTEGGPGEFSAARQGAGSLHGRPTRSVDGFVRFLRLFFLDFFPAILTGIFALAATVSKEPRLGLGNARGHSVLGRPDRLAARVAEKRSSPSSSAHARRWTAP